MRTVKLAALLENSAAKMRLDLQEQIVSHNGETGIAREEIVRRFLRSYLPKQYDVTNGFVFDCFGEVSQQLDIVISSGLTAPKFETSGGIRLLPCETVSAVGQVKSKITSRKELKEALCNLASAKLLDRSARGHAASSKESKPLEPLFDHRDQIFTFLVVTGRALSGATIQEAILENALQHPPHLWPNLILALDRFIVTYCCDDGVCPNPMHARGVALEKEMRPGASLMKFYLFLGRALESTRVASFPFWEYLTEMQTGSAEVIYSCADDPPPFLSSISR